MNNRTLKIMHVGRSFSQCQTLVNDTKAALKKLNNEIIINTSEIRETKVIDFRCELYINKVKGITWKQYYQAINSVKPVPFDFI